MLRDLTDIVSAKVKETKHPAVIAVIVKDTVTEKVFEETVDVSVEGAIENPQRAHQELEEKLVALVDRLNA